MGDHFNGKRKKALGFCSRRNEGPPAVSAPSARGMRIRLRPRLLRFRDNGTLPNTPGWSLRVVPNKFPALRIEGDLNREGDGVYDKMNGIGAHEVVVETPRHQETLATLPRRLWKMSFWPTGRRMIDLRRDLRLRYVMVF